MPIGPQLVKPPYGPAHAGSGLRIQRQILDKPNASAWVGLDITTRWTYRLRAWAESDPQTFFIDDAIAASTDDGTEGWLDDYVSCGQVVRDVLRWQIVEVDGDNADANTPTGQREVILEQWRQPILAGPITGATT